MRSYCIAGSKYKREATDLLREGAPIRPEPKSSNWKPDAYVSFPHVVLQFITVVATLKGLADG